VRIVQVSDTHLSGRGGVTNANFERVVAYVNGELRPDLVVNTGDLALLDPDDADDRSAAHRLHQAFEPPLLVLPGNHDVGEAGAEPWMGLGVTSSRIAAYRAVFGPDRWSRTVEDWVVIGIDSELVSSGLPEEDEQWAWLAGEVDRSAGAPVVLFVHKPLWWPMPVPDDEPVRDLAVDADGAARLRALFAPGQLRAVASGHLHRFRVQSRPRLVEVWAPSTAFLAGSGERPLPEGTERLGVVELDCRDGVATPRFVAVPGLVELDVGDVPEAVATRDRLVAQRA